MRPPLRCLSGYGPRAISGHIFGLARQRSAGAPCAERGGAGARRGDHRSRRLRELDRGRFGLGRVMLPARSADTPLANNQLFALPSMAPVRKALDAEFDRYISRHKASLPNETIGVGTAFDFQLFDRALLDSPTTRFVLAGIVNRMDRAYVHEADCGEIRLIYRLTRTDVPETTGEGAVSPRLPMTLNVVLKARGASAIDGSGKAACLRRNRPPLARRRRMVADRCCAGGKTDGERRPAGSDRARRHRRISRPTCRSPTRRNRPSAIFAPTIS